MNSLGAMFHKYVSCSFRDGIFSYAYFLSHLCSSGNIFCACNVFFKFDGPRSFVQSAIQSNRFSASQFRLTFVSFCVFDFVSVIKI